MSNLGGVMYFFLKITCILSNGIVRYATKLIAYGIEDKA